MNWIAIIEGADKSDQSTDQGDADKAIGEIQKQYGAEQYREIDCDPANQWDRAKMHFAAVGTVEQAGEMGYRDQ